MNLADLEALLYDKLNLPVAPDATRVAQIRRVLNEAYFEVMGRSGMEPLRRQLVTFSSVANTPFAALPQAATDVFSIADRTRHWLLEPMGMPMLRTADPGLVLSVGYPYGFAKYNLQAAVTQQPADASALYAKSTSASDGATKTAYAEVVLSDGSLTQVSAALNGVTAVQLGTVSTVVTVNKFWIALSAGGGATTAAGAIGLYEDSGVGTQLSTITQGRGAARYSLIHFYPVPTAVNTYTADVKIALTPLATGSDEPLIPDDYRMVLIHRAMMTLAGQKENSLTYSMARDGYRDVRGELILYCSRMTEPSSLHTGIPRYSQLGPYFPPGS